MSDISILQTTTLGMQGVQSVSQLWPTLFDTLQSIKTFLFSSWKCPLAYPTAHTTPRLIQRLVLGCDAVSQGVSSRLLEMLELWSIYILF